MNTTLPTVEIGHTRRMLGAPDAADAPRGLVGNTPVLWIGGPLAAADRGFWAKLEGFNPGGMKDRPALHMVQKARERGDLAPGARIIESTSGTLGLGLALAGMVYQHPVTVVTDPGLEPIVARMLAAYGATVDLVTEPHPAGGWQQARRERVAQLLVAEDDAWCPDQYSNPDNVEGYQSLALELIEQLGTVEVLVCAVGAGAAPPAPPAARPRAGPAPVQPRHEIGRCRHDLLDDLRPTGWAAPDARLGIEHLSRQRRL